MKNLAGLPAVPLITHDPYFSIWSQGITPTSDNTRHWSGAEKIMLGYLTVDGVLTRWLGREVRRAAKIKDISVTPLSSQYVYEDMGIRLTVRFTSPLLLDDLDILSTPITYVQFRVEFVDGKQHTVKVNLSAKEGFCFSGEVAPQMRYDSFTADGLKYAYMGQMQQKPLSGSGDHLTIDWGHLFFATADGELEDTSAASYAVLRFSREDDKPFTTTLLIGYDDTASINYFGRLLPAYYARGGKTIVEALKEFHTRQNEILTRCDKFDKKLLSDARKIGGKDYAKIVTAGYRQSIAAHKLVEDENGELLFISKEDDSNGCAATADVSYPSTPLYLLYNPELVRAMCRPILKFARMPVWRYDFPPHDAGRYPTLTGQRYGLTTQIRQNSEGMTVAPLYLYPSSVEAYRYESQFPVEESGNMILMLYAAGYADGDYTLAADNLDLLRQWCRYLLENGEDPAEQLCTDDFTGHLAHNVNLSAKAVMGIAAFSKILDAIGEKKEAAEYWKKAESCAKSWLKRAVAKDGHTYLSFEKVGWSMKYNLVWDRLYGWNLLPESFYEKELASYLPRINEYGLPLDSRATLTKTDWTSFVAAMAVDDKETFAALIRPMAKFLAETPCRVPFPDYYDTVSGAETWFIGRPVQGSVFMPMLMKKWQERR